MTGKIAGVIFGILLTRNILGALVGLYVGYLFDNAIKKMANKQNVANWLESGDSKQSIFFYSTFSVMGHVAKATGRVTPEHIQTASDFMAKMRLSESQKEEARDAFREGKLPGFPLNAKLKLFKQHFGDRSDLQQFFLDILVQTAYSDSVLEQKEYDVLLKINKELGYTKRFLDQLISMWEAEVRFQAYKQKQQEKYKQYDRRSEQREKSRQAESPSLQDAYALIGASERDSTREIKRAYKRLMSQNHPDKLVAKGLPPELMELAKQKTQDIQAAYDLIKKARQF
ncbi:co-chaperone DjlA [Psychrosphaera sp. 1_MG-2023]|uniref:co-chaperone DjlA n=1 Tax=Psychrosphaera sp. 1_MG-2023 TaxID=3062643 RepID=UPI0026E3DDCD|nr:co-chaperone DjlA [Psychrosphaera sp. 1_MG-2023]MDO6719471.1 co-chaperone DjlA [Psychrosphaera sp. 1_MG-2023]